MYIAVGIDNNVIFEKSETVEIISDEFTKLVDCDTVFQDVVAKIVEVESVPEDFEPSKYCYTDDSGITINEGWINRNPYGISNELLEQIKDDTIQEVQDELNN